MIFGPPPVSREQILEAIVPGFPFRGTRGDRRVAVKRALERLGKSLNYSVYYGEPRENHRDAEFVLDVAWWEPGRGLVLAAECEWGDAGSVARDFQKLMAVKAPLKVMVCNSRSAGFERQDIQFREDCGALLQVLGSYLLDFTQHVKHEHYLLLELVQTENRFRAYEYCVPGDGRLVLPQAEARNLFQPVPAAKTATA